MTRNDAEKRLHYAANTSPEYRMTPVPKDAPVEPDFAALVEIALVAVREKARGGFGKGMHGASERHIIDVALRAAFAAGRQAAPLAAQEDIVLANCEFQCCHNPPHISFDECMRSMGLHAAWQAAPQPEGGQHYLCTKCGHVGTEPSCRCGYAALLISPDPRIAALEAALRDVLERDAAFAPSGMKDDCRCINLSREAEREYEMGKCPHQRARALTTARAGKGAPKSEEKEKT